MRAFLQIKRVEQLLCTLLILLPSHLTIAVIAAASDQLLPLSEADAKSNFVEVAIPKLIQHADQLKSKGEFAAAAAIWEKITTWENENSIKPNRAGATGLNELAKLYYYQGLYSKAEALLLRSIEVLETDPANNKLDRAKALNFLGAIYLSQGYFSKAEPLLVTALKIREKALGRDHVDFGKSLMNLANLYDKQGLGGKAMPLYEESIIIIESSLGLLDSDIATALNNLATYYLGLRRFKEAESYNKRALFIYEKVLGAEHPDTAMSLNNLAGLYYEQGLYGKARPLFERALAIRDKILGSDHPDTAITLNNLAWLYYSEELYRNAERFFLRDLAITEKALGIYHGETSASLFSIYVLYSGLGLFQKAHPFGHRALTIESNLIQREAPFLARSERQSFVASLDQAYKTSFSSAAHGPSGAKLALFSRLNRQGLLEEIEKRQAQLASLPGAQQQVAQELRALTQQLSSLSITPEQRQSLKARQGELEQQLYRLLPELKPRIVDVEHVASELPAGGALVEFQRYAPYDGKQKPDDRWGEAHYLALVLKHDGSIAAIDLGPAAAIEERIQQALAASEQKLGDAQQLWAQVGDQILDPLASALSGVQTLFISPDGELNRIPFAALPAPGRTSLLTETLQLRLITTGRELLDLAKPSSKGKSGALVVANPAYDKFANGGTNRRSTATTASASNSAFAETSQQRSTDLQSLRWAPLPGTAKEGHSIATLTKARLLSGEQATAAAVQGTPAPRVLHIASHAFYLADQAKPAASKTSGTGATGVTALQSESPLLRSGIALAGANQSSSNTNSSSDTADDGYLTALEVAQLDWKGTELVVISACESGKGDIQAGEGVYGLKRAIAVAGARSSLLSLWKVDDRATAAFMESFYNKLKTGTGRADALAATQKEFREHAIAGWRHPYIWAAFQLSGDWGVMRW